MKELVLREADIDELSTILVASNSNEITAIKGILRDVEGEYEIPYDILWIKGYGKTKDLFESMISQFVEPFKLDDDRKAELMKRQVYKIYTGNSSGIEHRYKCYAAGKEPGLEDYHLSSHSSIRCAANILGNPDYVIILVVKKEEYEEFKKDELVYNYTI